MTKPPPRTPPAPAYAWSAPARGGGAEVTIWRVADIIVRVSLNRYRWEARTSVWSASAGWLPLFTRSWHHSEEAGDIAAEAWGVLAAP